jgi:very-short-patch-repair endonuclease
LKANPVIRRRAQALRSELTDAERILWSKLKGRQVNGWQFRNQHPVGPYIADFACVKARLIIEVDGASHTEDAQLAHDERRSAFLRKQGWHVHRVWNIDIYNNLNAVLDGIHALLPPSTQR